MGSMFFRAHEWLADHFAFVQYPRMRRVSAPPMFWRVAMPWPTRVGLVLLGVVLLAACAVALFFLCVLFWAMLTA